ncbi:MAG TPA: DUF6443 domain-containing protein, partial [Saprospiraceae bacterium]|nr:DUF6443 domain-containing protein [Saprospiraceae bacterium]
MTKYIIAIFLVTIFNGSLWSQPVNHQIGDVTMPSAEAASLGKYGDIPTNYFTGVSSPGIPIGAIQQGPLAQSVSLSYHNSGVKVAELASNVGLNWSLQAGGMISRTVNGLPDEDAQGWLFRDVNETVLVENISTVDTEPDVFSLSIPGQSYKFVFENQAGQNTSIMGKTIPESDIKIYLIRDGGITGFKVVLTDGSVCYFGSYNGTNVVERNQTQGSTVIEQQTGWYLLRKESADGNHAIDYEYERNEYMFQSPSSAEKYTVQYTSAACGTNVETGFKYLNSNNSFFSTNRILGYRIKKITNSSGKQEINFHYSLNNREDVESISSYPAKPLEKIEIKSGTFTKAFRLQYSYFQSPTTLYTTTTNGADGHLKRLKLDAIHEEDALGNSSGTYQFEYYGTNGDLPNRLSHAVDSWGFYNGKTGNDDNPVNVPRTVLSNVNQVYGSSDRDSDGTHMIKGSLRKITYPTGGSVEYELEANRYEFSSFENFSYESRNFVTTIYNFEDIEDPANYGCVSFTERGPDFALTAEEINTALVEIDFIDILMDFTNCVEQQRVFTGKLFTKAGQLIKEFGFNESIDIDWPAQSRTLLEWLDLGPSALPAGEYYFEITGTNDPVELELLVRPANVEKEVGGLRTKSIIKRDIDGSILDEIHFDYTRTDSELSSAYLYNSPVYGATIQSNQYTNVFFREMSITPLADFNGYHVGYERVAVSKPNNGKTVYIYDVEPSENPVLFPQVPDEYLANNGLLREEHHYEQGASNAVSSKTTSYINNYTDIISNAQKYFIHRESDPFSGNSCLVVAARTYAVRTAPQLVSTVTSTMDGLTTSNSHLYRFPRRQFLPYKIVTVHPDGTSQEVETDYVADLSFPTAVYQDMKDRNMVHIPIETRTFVNGTRVGGTKTDYSLSFDGFPRPQYVKNWNTELNSNMGDYEIELTFNSYDTQGNPNQITQRGWQSETFTWDSDQLLTRQFDNFIWTYQYHPNSRLLQRFTEPNGLFTSYSYDNFMRLESINQYNGKSLTDIDYQFHSVAGINKVTTTITHPDGADFTSEVEFDGLGRKTLERKVGYGQNNQNVITKIDYDNLGRVWKEYQPGFGTTPGAATTYTYEPSPLNRVSQMTPPAPLGPTTYTYGSENNLFTKTETNALGQINKTYTDTRGRMRKTVTGKSPELAETNYYYDDRNNLTNIVPHGRDINTDPNYIYTYTYDGRNNVLTKKIPEKALVEMRYDQRDQLTHYKDGIHPVVYTNYDAFGRVNQTGFVSSLSDVSIATADLLSDMDYVTNPSAPGFGQAYYSKIALLDPMGAPTGQFIESQTLAWDAYERPTSTAGNHPLNMSNLSALTSSTVYNDLDQAKSVSTTVQVGSDSWSTVSSSTYDHSGRLLVENFNFNGIQKEVSRVGAYDVWDNVTTKVLGGNLQTLNYGFYANGFLQSINSPLSGSITARSNATLNINSNADLFSMGLTYDAGGNIQTWTYQNRGFAPETNTYTYDGLNRIKTNTTASGLRNQS